MDLKIVNIENIDGWHGHGELKSLVLCYLIVNSRNKWTLLKGGTMSSRPNPDPG